MASTTTRLMSYEEFERLPDPSPWMRQELHHGELFEMPPPVHRHKLREIRLRNLIQEAVGKSFVVENEIGFRPFLGNEYWIADVAVISTSRWDATPHEGQIVGAPEMVIEVLSPSNRMPKMRQRRQVCLEHGSAEFWIVDATKCQVEVSTAGGPIVHKSGEQIPLRFAPGQSIAVDAIFA